MKFKSLILVASLLSFGASLADDFVVSYCRYYTSTAISQTDTTYFGIDLASAFEYSCNYLAVRVQTNTTPVSVSFIGSPSRVSVSNITTSSIYRFTNNPRYNYYSTTVQSCIKYVFEKNLFSSLFTVDDYIQSGNYLYLRSFNPREWLYRFYCSIPVSDLLELNQQVFIIGSNVQSIGSDVSSLVPALESHASNVSNLAQIVSSAAGAATNLQYDIWREVYGINYALNSGSGLDGIYRKLELLDPSTASPYWLGQAFASVYGMETYPDQALVSAGLASSLQDAQNKLADPNWCHKNLVPAIQSQKRKNAYIQQFQQDGLTPPAGKTWDQLSENELETIANYSYNTPVSSNATLQAHALDYLKRIKDSNDSIDASVDDIRQHIQGGPLEVNVMNWPDDIFGAANISNMFNDLISNFEASLTNFNPHYTWEDALFFDRSQYSWRGLNTLDFNPRHDLNSSPIGVSTFNFTPSGNYFQDVPNFLALQSRISVDIANMIATVTAYSQTNLSDRASTADLEQQYQEEFLQQSAEALNEFEQSQTYSNLLARNTRFIDTSSVFTTPSGFTEIFSGNHSIPSHVNLQLPSWHFGQDDQSTPDTGSTITIDTAQYATFFQNCRYVFLFLYWGMTVMIMIWLFRLFSRFISWIPLSLTGGGSHDTVSI